MERRARIVEALTAVVRDILLDKPDAWARMVDTPDGRCCVERALSGALLGDDCTTAGSEAFVCVSEETWRILQRQGAEDYSTWRDAVEAAIPTGISTDEPKWWSAIVGTIRAAFTAGLAKHPAGRRIRGAICGRGPEPVAYEFFIDSERWDLLARLGEEAVPPEACGRECTADDVLAILIEDEECKLRREDKTA